MEFLDFEAIKGFLGPFGFLLNTGFWRTFYFYVSRTLGTLGFIFLGFSVFVFIKSWPYRVRLYVREGRRTYLAPKKQTSLEEENRAQNRRKWDSIIKKAESAGSAGYPMAVIEADIMLEEAMGRLGFLGKNLAERLRSATPADFSDINSVWEAHKLRNKIAHEPNFRPSREETTHSLGVYKKALEGLGVI